jgi:hypothetical protein
VQELQAGQQEENYRNVLEGLESKKQAQKNQLVLQKK